MVNYNIDVYLKHTEMENMYVSEMIELVTNDYNGNIFNFTIYDGDKTAYDLTGKTVTLVVKSDLGTVIEDSCSTTDATKGQAKITLPSDMFCEKGIYYAEVQIWKGTTRITTLPFDYSVRLSLDSDEAVKADNRFSLLQQALDNVASSDATSKEALKIANQAKAVVDVLVPQANTAATKAQEALDRAESVVTQEELNNKVTLDKVAQTNFDFIKGKVVQDGLVKDRPITVPHVVFAKWKGLKTSTYIVSCNIGDSKHGWGIYWNSAYKTFALYAGDGVEQKFYSSNTTPSLDGWLYAIVSDGTIEIITNTGGFKITGINFEVSKIQKTYAYQDPKPADIVDILPYSEINSKVIQHNVSTLNNTPSITQLQTIDAQGKTSILQLGSDEDHVEMSTGRTLRQEYMGLLKANGKEFTAVNNKIEVNNGLEARIISAEINGQTVKNIADLGTTKETNYFKTITHSDNWALYDVQFIELGRDKKYKVRYEVIENTLTVPFLFSSDTNVQCVFMDPLFKVDAGIIGIFEREFTPHATNSTRLLRMQVNNNVGTGKIVLRCTITEVAISSYIPFGLSSTQAIISNNGMKYPFYHPTELNQDGSRKVISLGKVGDVCDNLDLKDGGNSVFVQPLKKFNYTGSSDTSMVSLTNTNQFSIKLANVGLAKIASAISSEYNYGNDYSDTVHFLVARDAIYVHADKVKFPDVDTFNKYCQATPLQFIYQLEAPIITNIPKELIQPIQIDKINILSVDSAVKPSSFKAMVPVDRIAEQQAEIDSMKKQLGALATLQLDQIK